MRYYGSLIDCARRARRNVEVSTQRIRSKLLADLEKMFDMAKAHATDENITPKQRQIWTRIMAYLGQVMNSLTRAFDEAAVTKDLEQLEKMMSEAMAKGENQGTETKASGSSGS